MTTTGQPVAVELESPPPPGPAQPPPRRRFGSIRLRGTLTAAVFLAPALITFLLFKFIPMGRAIQMSFHEVRPYLGDVWVGFDNYTRLLSEAEFLTAVWQTVILAVGQTAGSLIVGIVLALLLEGSARHLWIIRTAVFLPTVVALAVVAEVWRVSTTRAKPASSTA